VTTFPRLVERGTAWALGLLLSSCGAKTDLPRDGQTSLDYLPECGEEGATRPCESICGEGVESCFEGRWQFCNAERPRPPTLEATVRDFLESHADFEPQQFGFETGIVATELGPQDKPLYAGTSSLTTTGATNFDMWYRDVPGVNTSLPLAIELLPSALDPESYEYEDNSFFPIDGLGFGNEGSVHNFLFTLEVSTAFRYVGGEVFSFTGDDDLWVFINRKLAIDLGGIHASMTASVDLDSEATRLGLEPGGVYPLHLFFAERHAFGSNFNVHTTIAEFELCE
jgi:fibro-slime domain-containing protein